MTTGGNAYMPVGEFDESNECDGCDECEGRENVARAAPDLSREQTIEERLEATNLLLGHVAGQVANVAEAIHTTEQGAEARQDEWIDLIRWATEIQQKTQKTGLIVVGCLILVISTLTYVVVNLIM